MSLPFALYGSSSIRTVQRNLPCRHVTDSCPFPDSSSFLDGFYVPYSLSFCGHLRHSGRSRLLQGLPFRRRSRGGLTCPPYPEDNRSTSVLTSVDKGEGWPGRSRPYLLGTVNTPVCLFSVTSSYKGPILTLICRYSVHESKRRRGAKYTSSLSVGLRGGSVVILLLLVLVVLTFLLPIPCGNRG